MCEKDGYVRNYKSYSEGDNLVVNGTFDSGSNWFIGDSVKILIADNKVTFDNATSFVYLDPFLPIFNTPSSVGKYFLCYFEVTNYVSGSIRVEIGASVSGNNATPYVNANGKYLFIVQHTTNSINRPVLRASPFTGSVTNFQIKELSGIHQISNYTTTSRTNAQRLSYGLQTSGFKRDNLGMILSKSSFLEADGVGYGNTGWIPSADEDWSIELVCKHNLTTTGTIGLLGTDGVSSNNRLRIYVFYHSSSNTRRPHIWIEDQFIAQSTAIAVPEQYLITLTYESTTKRYHYYLNSVYVGFRHVPNFTNNLPVKISQYVTYQVWETPLRLCKVHQKALAQEEVTKNFNTYESLGLLSESGEAIPNNAITDADGNYFVDENGNYIVINN
jgi:hypothetical protein